MHEVPPLQKAISEVIHKSGPKSDPSNYRQIFILPIISKLFESKQGCKDQESIQSSTTPDPGYQWESDKLTVRHHKREPRVQPLPNR